MKKGEEFELLVATLEKFLGRDSSVRVSHNVKLKTKKGNERQIDVLIEQTIDRFVFRTIIECKEKQSKVKATDVNAFKALVETLDAHQGIIVSKSGFQKGAITEAKNERILIHTLSDINGAFEYLKTALISQYHCEFQHIETIASFLDKKNINKNVDLFTALNVEGNTITFTLAQIVESFMQKERSRIPEFFTKNVSIEDGMLVVTDGEAQCDIQFTHKTYYDKNDERTYLSGFTSKYKVMFYLRKAEVEAVKQYNDITSGNSLAVVTEVKVGEEKFRLFEKLIH